VAYGTWTSARTLDPATIHGDSSIALIADKNTVARVYVDTRHEPSRPTIVLTTDGSVSHLRQAPMSMNGAQTLARRPSRASTAVSASSTSTSGNAGSWATAPAALRRTAPPGASVPPIAR
jgi:hypothetical protein